MALGRQQSAKVLLTGDNLRKNIVFYWSEVNILVMQFYYDDNFF